MKESLPMAERPLTVYVRKGERAEERILSFRCPEDIPQHHILAAGMALDGNAVVTGIGLDAGGVYRHPALRIVGAATPDQMDLAAILGTSLSLRLMTEPPRVEEENAPSGCSTLGHASLADALSCLESLLVVWLYSYGYMPEYV